MAFTHGMPPRGAHPAPVAAGAGEDGEAEEPVAAEEEDELDEDDDYVQVGLGRAARCLAHLPAWAVCLPGPCACRGCVGVECACLGWGAPALSPPACGRVCDPAG